MSLYNFDRICQRVVVISALIKNIIQEEILNVDTVIEAKGCESDSIGGFIELYAHGKIGLLFDGSEEYQRVAEECCKRSLDVRISVDDITFVRSMRDQGKPEVAINQVLKSCSVFDEVHLGGLCHH